MLGYKAFISIVSRCADNRIVNLIDPKRLYCTLARVFFFEGSNIHSISNVAKVKLIFFTGSFNEGLLVCLQSNYMKE